MLYTYLLHIVDNFYLYEVFSIYDALFLSLKLIMMNLFVNLFFLCLFLSPQIATTFTNYTIFMFIISNLITNLKKIILFSLIKEYLSSLYKRI